MTALARYRIVTVCVALWTALLPIGSDADPADARSSPEDLLLDPLPEVFTANRFKQQVDRAASAVSVITSDEIELYGIKSLADVFRYVPGVHVAATTASHFSVGMRGFNKDVSNKILVMVDGRSVYYDFYGHYWWYSLPVPIEEIRQIEIIRGPGSSLYGANAFDGVIHILTKKPGELSRGTGVVAYGNRETRRAATIASYADQDFGIKLSGEVFRNQAWRDRDEDSAKAEKFNLYVERLLGTDGLASLNLGRSLLNNEFISEFLPGRLDNEIRIDYVQGVLRKDGFTVQGFVTGIDMENVPEAEIISTRPNAESTTYDVEVNYHGQHGEHELVGGASYRRNEVASGLFVDEKDDLDSEHTQELFAVYVQDSFRVLDPVEIVAGLRVDHHPLTDFNTSPRVALLYTPASGHTLRLSYARAFRNPSFLESYGGNGTVNGFQVDERLAGEAGLFPELNEDPKPEAITSWEIGYRGQLARRVLVNAELFYNQIEDLIEARDSLEDPTDRRSDFTRIRNFADGTAYGAELDTTVAIDNHWEVLANGTYQRVSFDDNADPAEGYSPSGFIDDGAPRWLGNLGFRYRSATGLFATAILHHTDGWSWYPLWIRRLEIASPVNGVDASPLSEPVKVDAYTVLNGNVGWHAGNGLTITLAILNLLGNEHLEFGRDNHLLGETFNEFVHNPDPPSLPEGEASEEVGREVVLQVKYEF